MVSVKRSLTRINGVVNADVSLERAEAIVVIDDARITVEELTKATARAGYPSKEKR